MLNELQHSPGTVIDAILRMMKLSLDLDTGSSKSTTVDVILHTVRTTCRVENYLAFMVAHAKGEHESVRTPLRDVEATGSQRERVRDLGVERDEPVTVHGMV